MRLFPLNATQQEIKVLAELNPNCAPASHLISVVKINETPNIEKFKDALSQVIQRHESLRTIIEPDRLLQKVLNDFDPELPLIDFSRQSSEAALQWLKAERIRPFNEHKPLWRTHILKTDPQTHYFVITAHDLIIDGWSFQVILKEIAAFYIPNQETFSLLNTLPLQFEAFNKSVQQRQEKIDIDRCRTYWEEQIGGKALPIIDFPTEQIRPHTMTYQSASSVTTISAQLRKSLQTLASDNNCTLFMTLLAGYTIFLHRISNQDKFILGTHTAGRYSRESQTVIGNCANLLPLISETKGNPTIASYLATVRKKLLGSLQHKDYTLAALMTDLNMTVDPMQPIKINTSFNMQNSPHASELFEPAFDLQAQTMAYSLFDLSVEATDDDQQIRLDFVYNTALFNPQQISRMMAYFQNILIGMTDKPQTQIYQLPFVPPAEKQKLLVTWNNQDDAPPLTKNFLQLFAQQVSKTPNKIAVSTEGLSLTYRELAERSDQMALYLQKQGKVKGSITALLANRNCDYLIGMLGIFKANQVYLPLDPRDPDRRLRWMLEQSGTNTVLASSEFHALIAQVVATIETQKKPTLLTLTEGEHTIIEDQLVPQSLFEPKQPAYVIYTSGSTGLPKGAIVGQAGMVNHLLAKISVLELTQEDLVAQTASQCFDISVWQFLAPLLVGGSVHIFPNVVTHDPVQLLQKIDQKNITVFETTPSMLQALLENEALYTSARPKLDRLRWLIPTGEALPAQLCRRWISHYPRIPLLNAYGPTECSDDVTHHPIHWPPSVRVVNAPIGRAINGAKLYVLDAWQQPVPIGTIGELYVGGICVGLGYLNDPKRSIDAFIPDPFDSSDDATLYRTGDLVKYLANGDLMFIGRRDYQEKINGVRIELGEIEQTLRQNPAIQDCVVLTEKGIKTTSLAAFVVFRDGASLFPGELQNFLRLRLPQYMVPSTFVVIEAIPITPNGKVDRASLEVPENNILVGNEAYVAPNTAVEKKICSIWADTLQNNHIGIYDDLFNLGGRSLDAVNITARINQTFKTQMPVSYIYRNPTVKGIAIYLGRNHVQQNFTQYENEGLTNMDFLGKWTLKAGVGTFVTLQKSTGQLDVTGRTTGEDQKFNAYGTNDKFMLQAANGKYITINGTGYKADQKRSGQVAYFKLETVNTNSFRILDLGIKGAGPDQFYWNDVSGALQRLKKAANPPPSTLFNQTIVTVSLQDILNNNFPASPTDLSWAYLAEVDFSNVIGFFTNGNLQNSDFSKANLSVDLSAANLSNAQMQYVTIEGMSSDLSNAIVNGANLSHANLNNATITAKTQFVNAKLINANLKESTVEAANFTGATLTNADFTGATVSGCNFNDANLTGVKLSNASLSQPFIDLSKVTGTQFSSKTNFTDTEMRFNILTDFDFTGVNMSGADLSGCKMDNTILESAELSFANLSNVTLTGNINMHAANFSNATLTEADMTGAQLGGISLQFFVPKGKANFAKLLNGLNKDDVKAVTAVFFDNKIGLKGNVIINSSQSAPGRVWTVERTLPTQKTFTVRLETIDKTQSLRVYQSATTAILTNAFMKGVILTSSNLFNVRASGVQLYGGAKLDGNAILEGVQFDSANLASINLTQARMYGVNLDYANLVAANLQGAQLTTSANGGQVTLNSAQLQGADFTDSHLDGAIFTDAAVSISIATTPVDANGVWLFDTSVSNANLYIPELQAASPVLQLNQFPNEVETLLPHLQPGKIASQLIAAFNALSPKIELNANSLITTLKSDSFWKITDGNNQYVIFHACDPANQSNVPALGVAKGSKFTTKAAFTIPLSLEKNLISGTVNKAIITAFKKQNVSLSPTASVAIAHQPTDFQVVQPNGPTYTLWFGIQADGSNCGYVLFTRPSIPNLISLFANHSIPLSTRTTVISHGTTLWNVINDDENPFNPVTNYVEFFVRKNIDGTLSVFGSFLRVRRLSSAGQEEFHNVPCARTTITDAQLQPTTVCPNSLRKSVNINNQLPFAQWMHAKSLPKAPFCIPDPDGMFSCPQ